MHKFIVFMVFVSATCPGVLGKASKHPTLKPLSVCCDIPEIGDANHLANCTDIQLEAPCKDTQCIFESSGFLIGTDKLNTEVYKNHLLKWAEKNGNAWSTAVDKAIKDCVDTDPRQHLDYPCKAYDVFACTGMALLKKCPNEAWKC